jgi:hypothetical protein
MSVSLTSPAASNSSPILMPTPLQYATNDSLDRKQIAAIRHSNNTNRQSQSTRRIYFVLESKNLNRLITNI